MEFATLFMFGIWQQGENEGTKKLRVVFHGQWSADKANGRIMLLIQEHSVF